MKWCGDVSSGIVGDGDLSPCFEFTLLRSLFPLAVLIVIIWLAPTLYAQPRKYSVRLGSARCCWSPLPAVILCSVAAVCNAVLLVLNSAFSALERTGVTPQRGLRGAPYLCFAFALDTVAWTSAGALCLLALVCA